MVKSEKAMQECDMRQTSIMPEATAVAWVEEFRVLASVCIVGVGDMGAALVTEERDMRPRKMKEELHGSA
jgi:hypothetical protein